MEDTESNVKPHVVQIKSEVDAPESKTTRDVALLEEKGVHSPSIETIDSKPGESYDSDAQALYEECDVKPSTSKDDGVSALEVMKLLNPSVDNGVSQSGDPADSAKCENCALCLASPPMEDLREVNSREQLLVLLSGLLLGSEVADDVAHRIYKENHAISSYYCRQHFSTAFQHIAHEVRKTAGKTSVHNLLASGKTELLQRMKKIAALLDAQVEISGSDLAQFYWDCHNDYAHQGYDAEEEPGPGSSATEIAKKLKKPKPPAKKEGPEEECCLCLICGKSISLAESRFISKASNRGVILVSCLLMGYALPMKLAKLVLEEASLTRRSCRGHFIQAGVWLYETVKHALSGSEPIPNTFGALPIFIRNAIVMRIQECATLFGDYSVTENEVQLFYNDSQMRHYSDNWALIGAGELSLEARNVTAALNSRKSSSGKKEQSGKDLSQQHLIFKKCCLCEETKSVKDLQETPLTMSVLIVLLSCLHANDRVKLEKAKEVFITGQKPENHICNEHFFCVAAYLRDLWGKRYGDLTQVSFQRLNELLDDKDFQRLLDISTSFVEGHTPLRRSCLTTFFKWYRESYLVKKTKRWMAGAMNANHLLRNGESVKKREDGDEQDDIVEIPIESEQQAPKIEEVKSAFSLAFDKTGGFDGEESNSAQENTTSDQPSTSGSESVKKEACASFVDEAMEDELLDDAPHVNDFCNGVSAEDLLHMEDAFEDGKEEECPVAKFEDLTEAKTEVKEKSEDLARIEEVVNSVSKGIASVPWPQPTPQIFAPPFGARSIRHETVMVSAATLQSIRAPKRRRTEDIDATELLANANIHLVGPHVVQTLESPSEVNEKRTRFEIISSLSIRNRRAPFLPGLFTYASKRIHFRSKERLSSKCAEDLLGQSILYTIWWSSTGILYQAISLEENGKSPKRPRRMTSTLFLFQLNQVIESNRFSSIAKFGPILLCDQPRNYFDSEVIAKLHEYNIEILPYPPNSKDLLPAHYYFFEQLFQYLRNKNYRSLFTLKSDIKKFICTRPPTFFADAINELKLRWDLCIANKGDVVRC